MQGMLLNMLARTQLEVSLQRNNKGFVFREADFGFKYFPFFTFIRWPAAQVCLQLWGCTSVWISRFKPESPS